MRKKILSFIVCLSAALIAPGGMTWAEKSPVKSGDCDLEKIGKLLRQSKYVVEEIKVMDPGIIATVKYMNTGRMLRVLFFFQVGNLVTFQNLMPAHPVVELDKVFLDGLFSVLSGLKDEKCGALHPASYDKNKVLASISPDGLQWDDNSAAETVRNASKLMETGKESEALVMIEEALKKQPDNLLLKSYFASVCFISGEKNRSAELIKKAVEIWEDLFRQKKIIPNVLAELHTAYLRYNALAPDPDFMSRFIERAKKDPGDIVAVFFTGVDLFYSKKHTESLSWLEKLLPALEKESRVYLYLAMNNFKLKRQDEAEKLIAKAVELNPEDPDVYFCRSLIYREKDRKLAIGDLERYIKLSELPGRLPQKEKLEWIKKELDGLKKGENPKTWDQRNE